MDDEERRRAAGIRSMDDDEPERGLNPRLQPTNLQAPEARAGWGSKLGAAVDSMESQGYGIAEAMGIDSARRGRLDNAIAADRTNQAADEQLGIAGSWDEARGVGGTAKYLASQGINTIPQMAVTTAASLVNPALGASAAYGFALGDVLENQREQSGGTNLPSAMAVAAPYAASDYALGIQGKITRGLAARGIAEEAVAAAPSRINLIGRAEHALEGKTGMAGFAGRRALEAGKTFGEEAGSETFQELMNQTGRIAVDPNASYMDDDALQRYKESFIVGGALGGVTGGVTGGKYGAKAHAMENEPAPTKGNTPIGEKGVPEMGSGGPARNDTTSILDPTDRNKINQSILDYGRSQGGSGTQGPGGGVAAPALAEDEGNWAPTPPRNILDRQSEGDRVNQQLLGNGRGLPMGSPVAAQVGQEVGKAFPLPPEQTASQQAKAQETADTIAGSKEHAEGIQKLTQRAAEHGVGEKEALLFGSLEGALKTGLIDKPSFIVGVGNLASGNKQLIADTKKGIAALEAQHELNQKAAAAPAGGLQTGPAVSPATAATPEAPAGAQAPAPAPIEQAAQREVAAVKERLSPGRTITAGIMERNKGKPISPLLRRRLYQRLGLDEEGWPRAEKRTLAEIAQIEADEKGEGKLEGKKLDQKARSIQTMLADHGFPATKIDAAIDAMTDQDHSLDMRTVDPGAEERANAGTERTTPATSEGKDVEDQTDFEHAMSGTADERPEGAPEEGEDQLEAGEGIGTKSSATSSADREGFVAHEFKDTSALLAQSPDLTAGQQKLFAAVAEMHYSKVKEAISTLIADEEVFSPAEREMLAFVFKQGRTDAAEGRRDEAVQEARDIANTDKTAEEALAARNVEIIAKNAREDAAKAQRAASLARQVEEMDTGDALLDLLPGEMHADIAEAAAEWEQYALEGAPAWHGLAPDLQAQWVKGYSHSLDMQPRASQEQRVAASEAVSRRAVGRQESAAAAADRAAADTEAAIAAAQRREELRGLAEKQDTEEQAKAARKAERERKVGTTTVRTKRGKLNAKDTEATGGGGGTVADAGPRAEATQPEAPAGREGSHGAANAVPAAERTGSVDQEGSHPPADQDGGAAGGIVHGDWTSVVQQAPLMAEPPAGRAPSVKVELRRVNKEVAKGKITEAEALARVTQAAEQAAEHDSDKRSNAQLVRDADHTRAQLLEGRRAGDLDPDLVELADWFIRKNPQLVQGLAISIKSPAKDRRGNELPGPVGTYESMRRIMTLIKGKANSLTAVHEILHHMERMMPAPLRQAVTKAWIKALFLAKRKADAGTDENLKKFFDALMYYHFDEASKYGAVHPSVALKDAMDLLKSGKVSANEFYQYTNASEFWAVNGSRIVQGRFMGSEGFQHRIKAWMREFVQKLKGMVGMQSDAPIIKALDSIAKGDGRFVTGTMLSEGSGVGGVHNMYVGPEAMGQEIQAQREVAEKMALMGKTPADIRMNTCWFQIPYDKQWRYEVSDHTAKLVKVLPKYNVNQTYKLSDVLKHDDLYGRYPELKNANVQFFQGGPYAHYEGYFNPTSNTIGLNKRSREDVLDVLVHEIQHWVQYKEGFAVGSGSVSIANELNDEQAVHVGQKIAREQRRVLQKGRQAEQRMQAFMSHPDYPALIEAGKRGDRRAEERLTERIASDTMGISDYGVLIGTPSYQMIKDAAEAPSVQDAWATLNAYKEINDRHESEIDQVAAGNREQIQRLGYNSPALHEAYTRSAGELEAEETSRRREMDSDFREYFAPFPMTDNGVAPEHAVVSYETTGPNASEKPPGERSPNETTRAYKAQNRTVLGRAIPLDPAKAKANMSPKAEKLLRAGTKDGETNTEATQAIKAALRQVARDYPELSKVVNTVLGLMPEKGIALQVDGTRKMNVHGYVDFKGKPTMYLFTAEGREGLTPATFVHEALHAVVGARYYMLQYGIAEGNYAKLGIPKPQAMQAIKDFNTFYDEFNVHVRDFVKEQGGTLDKLSPQLRSSLTEAATKPDELFVRALTDPHLQQWLAQREYKGQSLLAKFKNWVAKNLFNITTGERPSWLDAAMTASNALAKASKADEANWEMHRAMNDRMGGAKAGEVLPDTVTNRVIDEHVQKLPKHLQPGAKFGLRSIVNGAKRGVSWITTTEDMVRIVEKAMPAARRYSDAMRNIVFDRQNGQLVAEGVLRASKNLAPGEREKASNFMRDSTLAKKWGYKPAYIENAVEDPAMRAKFMALLPATRKAVQDAFEHMHKNLLAQREAVVTAAEMAHGTDEAAKTRAIAKYDRLMAMSGDWPYMPLARFGDFMAVGRSEAFRDIEDQLKQDPKNKALREQYDAMETNPAHYEVRYGQTEAHAQAIADDMRSRFPEDHVEHFARDKSQFTGAGTDMFAAVARLRNLAADSGFSETSARTLQKLVNDLHLSLLSERSARQSDRARKGIAGFNDDMWRNFGSRAKSHAHFIASTRAMGTVQNHLAQLKREANAPGTVEGMDRANRSKFYNEFLRRHMAEMEWRPNSWVDNAMATTSFWKLLSSPSYLMMNLTQPWVMSAPVLAGRHGIGPTFAEMGKAYAQLIPLVRSGELAPGRFKNMPADVQAGIDALIKQGLISVSLDGELGKYGEGADAFIVTKGLKMTGDFLSNLSTKTEDMNRLATAIAALRLERARGAKPEDAVRYAAKILYDTHGDYSGFNAPPWMRSKFGRLASQFRKFQIMQVGLWFKLANDAFVGKGLSATERWAAMKSFGYSLGTMGLLGGALGMPGATVIALGLGAAFGDPDEPNNPELAMRKWIGNDDLADLILKGVPAYLGADLSSRIGAGDIFSVLPYSDPEVSKAGVDRMALKVLGPAIGMLEDTADGIGMMMNGDYWKGLEKLAPRGLSDVSKGVRLASQGFTNKAGETTVQADDVGAMAGVMQSMGIATSTLTDRSFRASAKYTQDKYYTSQTQAVKKSYTEAYLDGDTDRMREARDQWTNMQAARKGLGYKPSPLSDLLKAPADRAKHEQQTIGGVQYRGQRDEGAARQLAEL